MTEGIILAIVAPLEAIITSVITFILTRRKFKNEVHGGEIENDGHKIDNKHNDLAFYMKLSEDNKVKLDELSDENKELRHDIAEMRSVIFSMIQQICTDMMCQNRKFDQEQCPYYDKIFKAENKKLEEYEQEI